MKSVIVAFPTQTHFLANVQAAKHIGFIIADNTDKVQLIFENSSKPT